MRASKKSGKKINAKEVFNVKKTKEEVKKGGKAVQVVVESLSDDDNDNSNEDSSEEEKHQKGGSMLNIKSSIKRGLSKASK